MRAGGGVSPPVNPAASIACRAVKMASPVAVPSAKSSLVRASTVAWCCGVGGTSRYGVPANADESQIDARRQLSGELAGRLLGSLEAAGFDVGGPHGVRHVDHQHDDGAVARDAHVVRRGGQRNRQQRPGRAATPRSEGAATATAARLRRCIGAACPGAGAGRRRRWRAVPAGSTRTTSWPDVGIHTAEVGRCRAATLDSPSRSGRPLTTALPPVKGSLGSPSNAPGPNNAPCYSRRSRESTNCSSFSHSRTAAEYGAAGLATESGSSTEATSLPSGRPGSSALSTVLSSE